MKKKFIGPSPFALTTINVKILSNFIRNGKHVRKLKNDV
jgi:hypothetical protein